MVEIKQVYKEHLETFEKLKGQDSIKNAFGGKMNELEAAIDILYRPEPQYSHKTLSKAHKERAYELSQLIVQSRNEKERMLAEDILKHDKMKNYVKNASLRGKIFKFFKIRRK